MTIAPSRRSLGYAIGVAALAAVAFRPAPAAAALIATINNAGSSGNAVTIDLTDPQAVRTFSIDVNVSVSPQTILSTQMKLLASEGGIVEITGGSYGPDWDPGWSLAIPVGPMNPKSGWFGALPLGDPPQLTGDSLLVTLHLVVPESAPPGEYGLDLSDIRAGDSSTHQNIGGAAGASFTVTLLPEPATLGLLALSATLFPRRRLRS